MAIVNISKAAELAGVSRVTIQRYLKNGTLGTVRQPDGSSGIDTRELLRQFGELKGLQGGAVQEETSDISRNTQLLQREIELLQGQIKVLTGELTHAHRREVEAYKREQQLLELLKAKSLTGRPSKKKKKGGKKQK